MGLLRLRRARLWAVLAAALAAGAWTPPAGAIETDQFYAWDRELADSTDVINAKVNLEIRNTLDRVNASPRRDRTSCHQVLKRVQRHFRLFLFHDLELWANNSSLVDRVPATPEEELDFRGTSLYSNHGPFDVGTWMPLSPTIEMNGIRLGTDKLGHFFSEGWFSYQWYRKALRRGMPHEDAEQRSLNRGILIERLILGSSASGVFSTADLEANYQGMLFYREMCDPDSPLLRKSREGWRLAVPFDFRKHLGPEWDESWQPSVFTARRWKKVEPILERYCPLLEAPQVRRRRAAYAARDASTVTERRLREMVEQGKLPDPERFSIRSICAERGIREPVAAASDAVPPGGSDPAALQQR